MIPHKSAVQYEAEVYKVIVTDQGNDTVHYFYNKDEAKWQRLRWAFNTSVGSQKFKEQFGDIYTKTTERVRKDYQIQLGAERYKMVKNFENVTKEVQL